MDITAIQPKIDASQVPLDQLAGNQKISDREKVAEVSRQFEAVLLRQILQQARKSSTTPASSADATTSGIYDDMINNQLADSISRSGSFVLAKSLQGQLAHQVLPGAEGRPASTAISAESHGKKTTSNP